MSNNLPDHLGELLDAEVVVRSRSGVVKEPPLITVDITLRPDLFPVLEGVVREADGVRYQWITVNLEHRLMILLKVRLPNVPVFTLVFPLDTPDQAQSLFLLAIIRVIRLTHSEAIQRGTSVRFLEFTVEIDETMLAFICSVPGTASRQLLVRTNNSNGGIDVEEARHLLHEHRVAKTA
jgi:hypothetical protein